MQKLSNGKTFVTIGFLGLLSAAALTIYATSPDNATRVVKNSVRTLAQPTPKAAAPIVVEPIQEDESPEAYQGYEKYAIDGSSRNDSRNVGTRVAKRRVSPTSSQSAEDAFNSENPTSGVSTNPPTASSIVGIYVNAVRAAKSESDLQEVQSLLSQTRASLREEWVSVRRKNPLDLAYDLRHFGSSLGMIDGAISARISGNSPLEEWSLAMAQDLAAKATDFGRAHPRN